MGCTAAAMKPKQARGTFRKHISKPFLQVVAPDCSPSQIPTITKFFFSILSRPCTYLGDPPMMVERVEAEAELESLEAAMTMSYMGG